jgi:predicted esterase
LSSLVLGLTCCLSASSIAAEADAFNIPRAQRIVVDGRAQDWGAQGFRVEMLTALQGALLTPTDSSAVTRLAWDERGLLVLMDVSDDRAQEAAGEDFTSSDSIELYLSTGRGERERYHVFISPGVAVGNTALRQQVVERRKSAALLQTPLTVESARVARPEGYTLEVLFPWKNLGITPAVGKQLAVQIYLNDSDGEEQNTQWAWYPQAGSLRDSNRMYSVRLAERADTPIQVVATARYDRLRRVRVEVTGNPSLIGRDITLRDGKRLLASGKLGVKSGWASAQLTAPMPPIGQAYGPLTVSTGRDRQATIALNDPQQERRKAFEEATLAFRPAVFSGTKFPSCEFTEPSMVEDAIGEYELKTAFYDADYNSVTTAEKPGRYGAIVETRNKDGLVGKRYITLFRSPGEVGWEYNSKMAVPGEFPTQLGIDPQVVKDRTYNITSLFRQLVMTGINDDSELALTLAGLYEMKPGLKPYTRTSPWSVDRKWWYILKKKTGNTVPLKYIENLPPGYNDDLTKKWPLVVFLHGIGETGDDVNIVKRTGLPEMGVQGKTFPFVMVSPQAPVVWWLPIQLNDFVDEMLARYRIDPDRIYFTGLSMGGMGTFNYALEYGDRLAAIAPMAIGGEDLDIEPLKSIPIWHFYGGRDGWITTSGKLMTEALKKAGANARTTFYPEATHSDTWYKGYAEPELYEWMLKQRRSDRP